MYARCRYSGNFLNFATLTVLGSLDVEKLKHGVLSILVGTIGRSGAGPAEGKKFWVGQR